MTVLFQWMALSELFFCSTVRQIQFIIMKDAFRSVNYLFINVFASSTPPPPHTLFNWVFKCWTSFSKMFLYIKTPIIVNWPSCLFRIRGVPVKCPGSVLCKAWSVDQCLSWTICCWSTMRQYGDWQEMFRMKTFMVIWHCHTIQVVRGWSYRI